MTDEHLDYPCFVCRRPANEHTSEELERCEDAPLDIEIRKGR